MFDKAMRAAPDDRSIAVNPAERLPQTDRDGADTTSDFISVTSRHGRVTVYPIAPDDESPAGST